MLLTGLRDLKRQPRVDLKALKAVIREYLRLDVGKGKALARGNGSGPAVVPSITFTESRTVWLEVWRTTPCTQA